MQRKENEKTIGKLEAEKAKRNAMMNFEQTAKAIMGDFAVEEMGVDSLTTAQLKPLLQWKLHGVAGKGRKSDLIRDPTVERAPCSTSCPALDRRGGFESGTYQIGNYITAGHHPRGQTKEDCNFVFGAGAAPFSWHFRESGAGNAKR